MRQSHNTYEYRNFKCRRSDIIRNGCTTNKNSQILLLLFRIYLWLFSCSYNCCRSWNSFEKNVSIICWIISVLFTCDWINNGKNFKKKIRSFPEVYHEYVHHLKHFYTLDIELAYYLSNELNIHDRIHGHMVSSPETKVSWKDEFILIIENKKIECFLLHTYWAFEISRS